MLEVLCFEIISMSSKPSSSFLQVHYIPVFTRPVTHQTDLVRYNKFVCTLLAEDVAACIYGYESQSVVYREKVFQLELLVSFGTNSARGWGINFYRSFRRGRRQPKRFHCPECLLLVRSRLHTVSPVKSILVYAVAFIVILGYRTMVLLIKSINLPSLLQHQSLFRLFVFSLLLSSMCCRLSATSSHNIFLKNSTKQQSNKMITRQTANVEGLDGVLAEPLLLRSISELSLLVIGEKGEIVIVLRVSLRHVWVEEKIGMKVD
nr:hypothetical protein B296_00036510 [Ipomoea batatas]